MSIEALQAPAGASPAACWLCGSTSILELFSTERAGLRYTVVDCPQCDLLQTLERHDGVSPTYVDLPPSDVDAGRIWCQGDHKLPAFRQWAGWAAEFLSPFPRPPRILDIGCGTGGFLRFAQDRGYAPYGFDASQAQADFARTDLPEVRRAFSAAEYLQVLSQPDLRFDVCTMWDVLEHVRDPISFLRSVAGAMRPGGLLFVSVPNGRAMRWKRRLLDPAGRRLESDWLPWEHVSYFSPASLRTVLSRAGFHTVAAGAVKCYRRPLSLFEIVRRIGFSVLSLLPFVSPQIFAWAEMGDVGTEGGARAASGING